MNTPKALDLKADPWLLWHGRLGPRRHELSVLPHPEEPQEKKPPRFGVLVERKAGRPWPVGLTIAKHYLDTGSRIATGWIDSALLHAHWIDPTQSKLSAIRNDLKRLKVTQPVRPQLATSRASLEWSSALSSGPDTGEGVVIGFVDNGCAFAHPHFLSSGRSRVERLWDQTERKQPTSAWSSPLDFEYGWEIRPTMLAPSSSGTDEDNIYRDIGYRLQESIQGEYRESSYTHGTHIMDIAAGDGAVKGMAPAASIIFVQFPAFSIEESTEQASARHILDGVAYIFQHAGNRPAVVNISYNSFAGPHDGTSLLEQGLDELLSKPNRAVVMSAGNGGNTNCHATSSVGPNEVAELHWETHPGDETDNFVEIWYPSSGRFKVSVRSPRSEGKSADVEPGHYLELTDEPNGHPIGLIVHRIQDSGTPKNQILVALNPTVGQTGRPPPPSGIWTIHLTNLDSKTTRFHAWIERDDRGPNPRVEQTRFIDADAVREGTLGGFCTGARTIVVGAYNAATNEVLDFSSLGPSLNKTAPMRPDVYAPGASEFFGGGVLAAAARSALPVRLAGTSMAAPFVTGLIALMFQRAKDVALTTEDIRRILLETAISLKGSNAERIDPTAALAQLQREIDAGRFPLLTPPPASIPNIQRPTA